MKHKFIIKEKGVLCEYQRYEDIPLEFDHVIEFKPYIPDTDQHTHEEHDEIAEWNDKLKDLMKRERPYASRY